MKHLFIIILIFNSLALFGQSKAEEIETAKKEYGNANNFRQQYKLDDAYKSFKTAGDIFKKYESWQNYITCYYSMGDILLNQNKPEKALNVFKESENVAIEKLGNKHKILININYGLGIANFNLNKIDLSIEYFLKSDSLNTELTGGNNIFTANVSSGLGNAYSQKGNYDEALRFYQKDYELRSQIAGEDNPDLALVYYNLGNAYLNTSGYEKAKVFMEKALNLSIKTSGENSQETAKYYSGLGNIYLDMGQLELANDYVQKGLDIKLKIYNGNHPTIADDYNNLGIILQEKGEFVDALSYHQKALAMQQKILGDDSPEMALTCNNIGLILKLQGKEETALAYYEKAIKIKSKYFGDNHPELAYYYNNIGVIYHNQNKIDKAIECYNKAIKINLLHFGNKTPKLVKIYNNLASIYSDKFEYNTALYYYQKSLIANVSGFNPDSTDLGINPKIENYFDVNKLLISLQGKAQAFDGLYIQKSKEKDIEKAFRTYILADSVVTIASRSAVTKSDRIALSAQTKDLYENAIRTSIIFAKLQKKDKYKYEFIDKAFYFSERNKAGVLSSSIAAADAKKFAGIPEELLDKETNLLKQIAELEKKLVESSNKKDEDFYRNELFERNNLHRELVSKFEKEYPKYFEMKYKELKITSSLIKNTLNNSTALRSYYLGDTLITVFTITKDSTFVEEIVKPLNFNSEIEEFRKVLTSGYKSDIQSYTEKAFVFYKLLFPKDISSDIKNLIIIPDGILGIIPFEALFTQQYTGALDGFKEYPFLIKKLQINYFYSAGLYNRAVSQTINHAQNRTEWIGIAPVFDGERVSYNNEDVVPLPGTIAEVDNIAEIFAGKSLPTQKKLREQANEEFIKSDQIGKCKYLHIATHGIVNSETPELSCILLANNASKTNDGILYSGEIYNLKLDANLVVLSACETGLGKISKGEGIIGLSRALLYAGTDNIIVSLWKVSDESTSKLMIDFYKQLTSKQEDISLSLHTAKLNMINDGKYAHPYFWSPFILIGK